MSDKDNELYSLYFKMVKKWSMDVKMPFTDPDGNDVVLPMVMMSGREQAQAKENAERDTRLSYGKNVPQKNEASEWEKRMDDHFAYWTIYYSVRQPNDENKRFFPTKESVMDALTIDQAGILVNDYLTLQLTQPWIKHINANEEDKLEMLLEQLIESGTSAPFFLNSCTSQGLNALICFLIAKLAKLQKGSGSSGTQQSDMPTNE